MKPRPLWADLPLRDEIAQSEPYGAPQLDVPVRLNVNENPHAPSDEIRREMGLAVQEAAATINRYPDREATILRGKLAAYLGHNLTVDNVWAANGSNEIMVQILQAFGGPGRSVLTFTPSYSMYPEYARDTHTDYVTLPRTADFHIDMDQALSHIRDHQPSVVVVASPNNPTGTLTSLEDIAALAEASEGMVVIDEAYQEFSRAESALSLLDTYGNIIVSRTMSKAFAFAGGRLGYAAAAPSVVSALRVVRLPYHLSTITQAVACVALDHAEEMLAGVHHLSEIRDQAMEQLRSLGLTVIDSQANFFLFGPFADRHQVWADLVDLGVLVRETGPDHYLRVCAGTDVEMDAFVSAVATVWKGIS